jgi:hypothetical protein
VAGGAQALVVAGLAGQVGEQVPEPGGSESEPAAFAVEPEQHLGDGQTDQLGIAELGWPARSQAWTEHVVDGDVQCDDEVVETGAHGASQEVDVARATPTLGGLVSDVTTRRPHSDSESTI